MLDFFVRLFIKNWLLVVIVVLAFGLRFVKLGTLPYPLNGDEKAFGYYSWSISNFGTDEYGNKLPLYFPSIGDYKYPAYVYLSTPVGKLLGLKEETPRVLSALAGVIMVILIYQLTILFFKSRNIALISSTLIAISPWSLIFSRTASESNLMTTLILAGFFFLSKYILGKQQNKYLFLTIILLILSMFTYSAARIFIPIMILGITLFLGIKRNWKPFISTGLLLFLMTGISLMALKAPESRARANGISMFANNQNRQSWIADHAFVLGLGNPISPKITRTFFNKPAALIFEYTKRYLSHFSLEYLFVSGDIVKLNSVQNFGNFYIFEIIFFLVGLSLIIKAALNLRYAEFFLLLAILASPIAASGSIETPSAVRQLVGLPYFIVVISIGLAYLMRKIKIAIVPIGFVYLYFLCFLALSLIKIKPYNQPWKTDQGNKEMTEIVWKIKDKYKYVFLTDDPYIDFLFYQKIKPEDFLTKAEIESEEIGKWKRVKKFENIIFNAPENCPKIGQKNALYVCRGTEVPRSAKVIEVIRFNDLVPKYVLVEFLPTEKGKQAKDSLAAGLTYMVEGDGRYPLGVFEEKDRYYEGLILD